MEVYNTNSSIPYSEVVITIQFYLFYAILSSGSGSAGNVVLTSSYVASVYLLLI